MTTHKTLSHHPSWLLEPKLFETVLRLISQHDPEGIISPANPRGWTEYATEVDAMLPLLKRASSAADVAKIVRRVFRRCFGSASNPSTLADPIWKSIRRPAHKRALARLVDPNTPIEKAVNRIRASRRYPGNKLRRALIAALDHQLSCLKGEPQLRRIFGAKPE
jgi:hypothetical protein